MQTGPSARDVHVIPSAKSKMCNVLCLLVVAAYGLINLNSKWRKHSDGAWLDVGLQPIPQIPQLFAPFEKRELILLVNKIVHNIFLTRTDGVLRKHIISFNKNSCLVKWFKGLGLSDFLERILSKRTTSVSSFMPTKHWIKLKHTTFSVHDVVSLTKKWMTLKKGLSYQSKPP